MSFNTVTNPQKKNSVVTIANAARYVCPPDCPAVAGASPAVTITIGPLSPWTPLRKARSKAAFASPTLLQIAPYVSRKFPGCHFRVGSAADQRTRPCPRTRVIFVSSAGSPDPIINESTARFDDLAKAKSPERIAPPGFLRFPGRPVLLAKRNNAECAVPVIVVARGKEQLVGISVRASALSKLNGPHVVNLNRFPAFVTQWA